jgi:hypothetical protein
MFSLPALHPAFVVACAMILAACEGGQQRDREDQSISLQESRSCRDCRIVFTPEVTLREGGEQFGGVSEGWLVRDSRGRIYHRNMFVESVLLVFDSSGRFDHVIGRKGGGPGEFIHISDLMVGLGDTLYVFDGQDRAYTKIGPDHRTAKRKTIGIRIDEAIQLSPGRLVFNAKVGWRQHEGYVLHELRDDSIGRPLGAYVPPERRDRFHSAGLYRQLARVSDTTFWTAHYDSYTLELWTTSGRLLRRLIRNPEWFEIADTRTLAGRINPFPHDLQIDSAGNLWIMFIVRNKNWKSLAIEGPPAIPDMPNLQSKTGKYEDLLNYVVEVIDPERGEVLASLWSEKKIPAFVGPGRVYTYDEDELGRVRITISRIALTRPQ